MTRERFGPEYYAAHHTAGDRVALWYYARLIRRLCPGGGKVLDFGCGTGHLLKRLVDHFEAYGYDPSPYARSESRLQAPRAIILDDWTVLGKESLQAVVALHTLEHLREPAPTVVALARRLARGGIFLAVLPNPEGMGHWLKGKDWFGYRDPTHYSLLRRKQWLRVFSAAGLEIRSVRGDGMWDPPYVRLLPARIQAILFGLPAALQLVFPGGRPFLPPVLGECLILQARKP